MNLKHRQKIRLDREIYQTPGLPCFVTIATKGKRAIFSHQHLAEDFVALLRTVCEENNIPLYAYCIMPDHAHLLLSASETKGIIEFVREIKSRSTRMAWQQATEEAFGKEVFTTIFCDRTRIVEWSPVTSFITR
jgi:REP element-mobilizing transposase RayT